MIPLLYLTDRANHNLIPDETGIADVFRAHGIDIKIAVWDETDWTAHRNILIRTPWDYAQKHELFLSKIHTAAQTGANIIHSENIIRWNIDKRYLAQLAEGGFSVVPTHVFTSFRRQDIEPYLNEYGTVVIKPVIGAGGRNTFRLNHKTGTESAASLEGNPVLLQPFMPEIETGGELSFIFFGGVFSHAVIKTAAAGEFRVQSRYGGAVNRYLPSINEITQAEALLNAAKLDTVYARVDAVSRGGRLYLMELEILEPELFLRFSEGGMTRFAQAVLNRCK